MEIDRKRFKDTQGRPLTQGLFLEINYDQKYAVYTLSDEDKEYKGELYPSLKRLFLEESDPTEYQFANKHLLGWDHWQRLNKNVVLKPNFDNWRDELEVKLRSEAILAIRDSAEENFQAAKFIADRGWDKKGAGRPSKSEREREENIENQISEEIDSHIRRMKKIDV